MFVSHVYLGINVFEINIEREGKEKLASFSTIMTENNLVIIDYGCAFVTCGKITETQSSRKESSFPAEVALIKLIGVVNLQSPVIARKFLL